MDDIKISRKIQDDYQLERQFRETLYESENNTVALQTVQKELLKTRHALYSAELKLEKERGLSHDLRMQLKAAMDVVSELQQHQTENQVGNIQLQVKYDAMAKQYDSLMSQATTLKVRETECKIKIQNLEENLLHKDMINKKLEQTLKELERNSLRTITTIDQKIAKLEQEHQYLQKSCEAVITFNQRLQTVGLCTYAIYQKDQKKIKNLAMYISFDVGQKRRIRRKIYKLRCLL